MVERDPWALSRHSAQPIDPERIIGKEHIIGLFTGLSYALSFYANSPPNHLQGRKDTTERTDTIRMMNNNLMQLVELVLAHGMWVELVARDPAEAWLIRPAPNSDEWMLYDSQQLAAGSRLRLDYAQFHNVSAHAPYDLPPGYDDNDQVFVGSRDDQKVVSFNQVTHNCELHLLDEHGQRIVVE